MCFSESIVTVVVHYCDKWLHYWYQYVRRNFCCDSRIVSLLLLLYRCCFCLMVIDHVVVVWSGSRGEIHLVVVVVVSSVLWLITTTRSITIKQKQQQYNNNNNKTQSFRLLGPEEPLNENYNHNERVYFRDLKALANNTISLSWTWGIPNNNRSKITCNINTKDFLPLTF